MGIGAHCVTGVVWSWRAQVALVVGVGGGRPKPHVWGKCKWRVASRVASRRVCARPTRAIRAVDKPLARRRGRVLTSINKSAFSLAL